MLTTTRRLRLAFVAGATGLLVAACGGDGGSGTGGTGGTGGIGGTGGTGGAATCGDGVVDAGEDCDGVELGGATCESEGFGPGDIACASDCTFDVTGCPPAPGCGNDVLENDEVCDGTDLGDNTCATEGFDAGTIACDVRCMLDTGACCDDACPAENDTQCMGDVVQTCSIGAAGCLEWQDTEDCALDGDVCDASGTMAECIVPCTDDCALAGDMQCNGDVVETCTLGGDGCNDWVQTTDCSMMSLTCDPSMPSCVGLGDTCGAPLPLMGGSNVLSWTATTADYITSTPSCVTVGNVEGPDIVMEYTPTFTGQVNIQIPKPTSTRWVVQISDGVCGTISPELACISDWSPPELTGTLDVTAGTTYYFYAIDTSSGSLPLDNPLTVNLTEIDCATFSSQATAMVPMNGVMTSSLTPTVEVTFDAAVDPTAGIISLTGTSTTQTFDLSTSPSEVSFSSGDTVMTITPTAPFASGETVTVSWTGFNDATCGNAVTVPTWTFDILDCATWPAPSATTLVPADGATTATLAPDFTVDFDAPIVTNQGVVTITGTTVNLSYDLSMNPSAVSFSNGDATMTIDPGMTLPAGEVLSISWTGLVGAVCGKSATAPTWMVTVVTPPCSPGVGGVVGTSTSSITSGTSITEYYVAVDEDPNGYVYFGGTSALHRVPKAGGATEDVEAAAGIGFAELGYTMIIVGQEIYTVNSTTTGTTGHLFRISTDGGQTWVVEDYASFPTVPVDDFRGIAHHNGQLYLVTFDDTAGQEIWTVPTGGVGQQTATLLGTTSEIDCGGIAVDDVNIYLACGDGERVVRLPLSSGPTFTSEVITTDYDLSATAGTLIADDLDADGTADVLYMHSYTEDTWYICDPASPMPFTSLLITVPDTNYGLALDPVSKTLYMYDDTADNIIAVQ